MIMLFLSLAVAALCELKFLDMGEEEEEEKKKEEEVAGHTCREDSARLTDRTL